MEEINVLKLRKNGFIAAGDEKYKAVTIIIVYAFFCF